MADFLKAYAPLKNFEGGWCNVSGDPGGETYAGIARNFFPSWDGWAVIDAAKSHSSYSRGALAFSRHLAALPGLSDMVSDWYRREWWDRMGLAAFSQPVADELFEQAVNLGRSGAGKLLQRLCNAMNFDKRSGAALFVDLVVDGAVGPKTLAALARVLDRRASDAAVVHALNCLQGGHYIEVAAVNAAKRKFVDGWLTRTHCDPAEGAA